VKRNAPLVLSFIAGFIMILAFFFDAEPLAVAEKEIQNYGVIVAAFALGIASVNLVQVHARKISRETNVMERIYSALLIVGLVGMAFVGITQGQSSDTFQFWFNSVMSPSGATVFAMGAFYIASAAFRSFRIKNVDSTLLLISAAIVMLGGVPIGEAISSRIPEMSDWIFDIPNMAATRGMMIGAGIGAIGSGVRVLLGIERSYIGRTE
jgi:lysylphosphatidylglycerol synthetase-like protein (DUF2156 family)